MRIFIITMDDPIQTNRFVRSIIDNKKESIVGIAITSGGRLTINKKQSKFVYGISLLLIMGIPHFFYNFAITIIHAIKKKFSYLSFTKDPTIFGYANQLGIPVFKVKNLKDSSFLASLKELSPDLIINQCQFILKEEILSIPSIGVINRHNALLPKNRGRLTPFWVLYKGEKETGVSIHFVDEGIDSGQIIVQKKYPIERMDTFNSIVKMNYKIAPKAMLEAIEKLESGERDFIKNDDSLATFNSTPTIKDAWSFRFNRLFK
jgi:methionyl-tRNA formyltransferase